MWKIMLDQCTDFLQQIKITLATFDTSLVSHISKVRIAQDEYAVLRSIHIILGHIRRSDKL